MNGNQIKQIKISKAKLENVVEKGLKSNTWTRLHNPSSPHDESKMGSPSLDKTACTIGLCKRWPWVTYFGVPPKALELESFSFKFPPLYFTILSRSETLSDIFSSKPVAPFYLKFPTRKI